MVLEAPLDDAVQAPKTLAEAEEQPNADQGGHEGIKALDHQDSWAAVETIFRDCLLQAQLCGLGEHLAADAFQRGVFVKKVEHETLAGHDEGAVVLFLQGDEAGGDALVIRDGNNRLFDLPGSPLGGEGGDASHRQDLAPIYDHLCSIETSRAELRSAFLLPGRVSDSDA